MGEVEYHCEQCGFQTDCSKVVEQPRAEKPKGRYKCVCTGCGFSTDSFRELQFHHFDHRYCNTPLELCEHEEEYFLIPMGSKGCIEGHTKGKKECYGFCRYLLKYKDNLFCSWVCPIGRKYTSECNDTCIFFHKPDTVDNRKCLYDEYEIKVAEMWDEADEEAYQQLTTDELKIMDECKRLNEKCDEILAKNALLAMEIYSKKWKAMSDIENAKAWEEWEATHNG